MGNVTVVVPGALTSEAGNSQIALQMADAVDEAASVVEQSEAPKNTWTSSTGIKFRLRKVSRMAIVEASRRFHAPAIPTYYDDQRQAHVPNPNDPTYIDTLASWNFERGIASMNVYLILGSEPILDSIPEGVHAPQSDEWIEELQDAGVEILNTDRPRIRYAKWIRLYALNDDKDLTGLSAAILRYSGIVTEAEVAAAEDSFRSESTPGTDT